MRLTVSAKVLLLVAVPLICEISFFVVLTNYINLAQQQAAKARHGQAVSDAVHDMIVDVMTTRVMFRGLSTGGFVEAGRYVLSFRRKCKEDTARIRKLLPNDVKAQTVLDQVNQGVDEIYDAVADGAAHLADGDLSELKNQYLKKVEKALLKIINPEIAELARESARQGGLQEQDALRESTKTALNGLLLASIALSLAMALYSSKQISGRINRVSENTHRFAHNRRLLEPLSGSDEIADLDAVFHEMAERIDSFVAKQQDDMNKVRQAERLKADVVAMVTHDLRAPLNSIMHFQEMLEEGFFGELNDNGHRMLKLVGQSSRTMQTLINDLLELEKIASGRLELSKRKILLSQIISQAVGSVQLTADENAIEIIVRQAPVQVEVDPDRICQVLINLLSNALKFSPKQSQIVVDVAASASQVKVSIIDKGPGISENDQSSIFDHFKQGKSDKAHLGSGLGLSICKALIGLHKGTIWVESELGRGSCFNFTLPL
jgi:signal transduction histidine kinase